MPTVGQFLECQDEQIDMFCVLRAYFLVVEKDIKQVKIITDKYTITNCDNQHVLIKIYV